jgi:hypothetical protein
VTPERGAVEERAAGERLRDQRFAVRGFAVAERTSFNQPHPQRRDEARAYRVHAGHRIRGPLRAASRHRRGWTQVAPEPLLYKRQVVGVAGSDNARHGAEPFDQLIGKGLGLRTARHSRRRLKREDIGWIVATLDGRQPVEAVNQQRAADQQRHRHCDFNDHERVAHARTGAALREAADAAWASVTKRRQNAAEHAGRDDHEDGKQEHR